jgi:aminopeptidase-like protein
MESTFIKANPKILARPEPVALLTHLAKRMIGLQTRYSYRFLFAPGTIGAITWLARNEYKVHRIKHGLVLSNLPQLLGYARSHDSGEIELFHRLRTQKAAIFRT